VVRREARAGLVGRAPVERRADEHRLCVAVAEAPLGVDADARQAEEVDLATADVLGCRLLHGRSSAAHAATSSSPSSFISERSSQRTPARKLPDVRKWAGDITDPNRTEIPTRGRAIVRR
jgi:hypothetical protein